MMAQQIEMQQQQIKRFQEENESLRGKAAQLEERARRIPDLEMKITLLAQEIERNS